MVYGHTLLLLYNALIKPHFIYCITVWGNACKTYMDKMFVTQKKIIRIITRAEFRAHTLELFKKSNLLNISNLHKYFVSIFVYKALHMDVPILLGSMFTRNFNARQSANLRSVYCKKQISQSSMKTMGPKIWNLLPVDCKNAKCLHTFRKFLKKHLHDLTYDNDNN